MVLEWIAAFVIIVLLLVFLGIFFWLWMIVDCLKRSEKRFPNKGKNNERLIWVIVIVFLNVIGALLYYFLVKTKK